MTTSVARRALVCAGLTAALLTTIAPGATFAKKPACGAPFSSYPQRLTAIGSGVWFVAADAKGHEPWISGGTAGSTRLIKDIVTP